MEKYQDDIARIRQSLADHPKGMSITDIADAIHVNRNSVAKYMDILQVQGAVDGYHVGTSKLYFLSSRLPASSVRDICTRPFLLIDRNGAITDTNTAFAHLVGSPRERMVGRELDTLPITVAGSGSLMPVFRSAIKGTGQSVTGRMIQANGHLHTATCHFQPVVFDNGRPGAALIIDEPGGFAPAAGTDTSFAEILALLDDEIEYVVRHTPDGIIRFVNETYCRAAGKTKDEMIGRPFRPLVTDQDAARIQDHRSGLTLQNPAGTIEFRAVMAEGDLRWQLWKERALFNDSGQLTGYQSFGTDITETVSLRNELLRAQEAQKDAVSGKTGELREINRQLYAEIAKRDVQEQHLFLAQSVLDHTAFAVFLVSHNTRIHYANRFAADLLGYTIKELQGRSCADIFPEYGHEQWNVLLDRIKHDRQVTGESVMVARNRDRFPAEVVITPLIFRGNGFSCLFARVRPQPAD